MLQLHPNDQQFYCLARFNLIWEVWQYIHQNIHNRHPIALWHVFSEIKISGLYATFITALHWGQNKMADILQTTFSNAFCSMIMYEFRLKFHWSLFLRVQLTTRTTRTPAFSDTPRRPMITHTSDSHQIPSQSKTKSKLQILKNCQKFKFAICKKLYMRHTFWSCLARCVNMKWIQPEM